MEIINDIKRVLNDIPITGDFDEQKYSIMKKKVLSYTPKDKKDKKETIGSVFFNKYKISIEYNWKDNSVNSIICTDIKTYDDLVDSYHIDAFNDDYKNYNFFLTKLKEQLAQFLEMAIYDKKLTEDEVLLKS